MADNWRETSPVAWYRVEITGCLPSDWAEWFDGMSIAENMANRNTVLVGPVRDQAALYGLINKVYALGLSLVAVNPQNVAPYGVKENNR